MLVRALPNLLSYQYFVNNNIFSKMCQKFRKSDLLKLWQSGNKESLRPVTQVCLCVFGATAPQWARTSSFMKFLDHTQRCTTLSRTPLDEWSARRRDVYLTTHNSPNRQTSMPPVGFEPTMSAGERPQAYALGRAATGTGQKLQQWLQIEHLAQM